MALQDHGNPVRFRNIWVRPLRPRPADGGSDGRVDEVTTTAKRKEIAEQVRARAAEQSGFQQMVTLLEAYQYDLCAVEWAKCDALVAEYVSTLQQLAPEALRQSKQNALHLYRALQYLQKHGMVEAEYTPASALRIVAIEQEWVKTD